MCVIDTANCAFMFGIILNRKKSNQGKPEFFSGILRCLHLDNLYNFMESPSSQFIETNLNRETMGNSGLILVSSRPVITIENQGPVRGTLVLGRLLTDAFMAQLREQTQVMLTSWK